MSERDQSDAAAVGGGQVIVRRDATEIGLSAPKAMRSTARAPVETGRGKRSTKRLL